jgi:tetratricopeptide (TPR) repeat protein
VLGQQKKHAQAIAALEEVVRASPDWPAGRRELGRAILDSLPQDKAEVNRALDLLIGVQPQLVDDWRLQESIGDAWLLLGDFDAAVLAYTEALRLGQNPKSVEDRYRVAVTKQRERDSAAVPPPKRP